MIWLLAAASGDASPVPPLLVQQTETIEIISGAPDNCQVKLGVGHESPRRTFSARLEMALPAGIRPQLQEEGILATKTIKGNPFAVPYTVKRVPHGILLSFAIRKAPTGSATPGSCCNCDTRCGAACSVEFTFDCTGDLRLDHGLKLVSFTRRTGQNYKVSIEAALRGLDHVTCGVLLPNGIPPISIPDGWSKMRNSTGSSWIVGQLPTGEGSFVLILGPEAKGKTILLKASGDRPTSQLPKVTSPDFMRIIRTESAKFVWTSLIEFE